MKGGGKGRGGGRRSTYSVGGRRRSSSSTPTFRSALQSKGATPMASEGTKDFIRIILSVIIPPVGVFFQVGLGLHFWINILLTLLGYIPGLLHAIWIILKED
jgi:uncharacterized membrane protein YqaE (UPF0057 family)